MLHLACPCLLRQSLGRPSFQLVSVRIDRYRSAWVHHRTNAHVTRLTSPFRLVRVRDSHHNVQSSLSISAFTALRMVVKGENSIFRSDLFIFVVGFQDSSANQPRTTHIIFHSFYRSTPFQRGRMSLIVSAFRQVGNFENTASIHVLTLFFASQVLDLSIDHQWSENHQALWSKSPPSGTSPAQCRSSACIVPYTTICRVSALNTATTRGVGGARLQSQTSRSCEHDCVTCFQ